MADGLERHRPRAVRTRSLEIGARRQRERAEVVERANANAREALAIERARSSTSNRVADNRASLSTMRVTPSVG